MQLFLESKIHDKYGKTQLDTFDLLILKSSSAWIRSIKIVENDRVIIKNKNDFFASFDVEELGGKIIPDLTSHFFSSIIYSLFELRQIIVQHDIKQIYLSFNNGKYVDTLSEEAVFLRKSVFRNIIGMLNFLKNCKNENLIKRVYDSLLSISIYNTDIEKYIKSDIPPHKRRLGLKLIERKDKEIEIIEPTMEEEGKIKNLTFHFCDNYEYDKINASINKELPFYYLKEDLRNHNADFLSSIQSSRAISLNDINIYDHDYFTIFRSLNHLKHKPSTEKIYYHLSFIDALDVSISNNIRNVINLDKGNRLFFLFSENEFVNQRIINHISNLLGSDYHRLSYTELKNRFTINSKFIVIDNIEELSKISQSDVWRKMENTVFKNAFVLFIINKMPDSTVVYKNIYKDNSWRFQHDQIKNNISKIFHSLLCEHKRIEIDDNTIKSINKNRFSDLIEYDNSNLAILNNVINKVSNNAVFDYNSYESWYKFREEYRAQNAFINEISIQECIHGDKHQTVSFIFNDDYSWTIKGLSSRSINDIATTKSILYVILTIEYNNLNKNKGIDPFRLIILSDYYQFILNKLDMDELEEKLNREPFPKNDREAVDRMISKDFPKKFDSNLKSMIIQRINFENNKVIIRERIDPNDINPNIPTDKLLYKFEVKSFPFDYELFGNNFVELIKKKVFNS